jgi:hypothetical protein
VGIVVTRSRLARSFSSQRFKKIARRGVSRAGVGFGIKHRELAPVPQDMLPPGPRRAEARRLSNGLERDAPDTFLAMPFHQFLCAVG